jgi:hypothetical protein
VLIAAALGCVEHGDPDRSWLPVLAAGQGRVHQHGQPIAVRAEQVEGDLLHAVRHQQRRTHVRAVVDPAPHREQVGERGLADHLCGVALDEGPERRVGLDDDPVRGGGEEAAGSRLVQRHGVVMDESVEKRRSGPVGAFDRPELGPGARLGHLDAAGAPRRKVRIAAMVSFGALRCGQ